MIPTPTLFFNGSNAPVGGLWKSSTGTFDLKLDTSIAYHNASGGFYSLSGGGSSPSQGLMFVSNTSTTFRSFASLNFAQFQSATFEFLLKPDSACQYCVVFSVGRQGNDGALSVICTGTSFNFSQVDAGGSELGRISYNVGPVSEFIHVLVSLDVASGVTIYINGINIGSRSYLTSTWADTTFYSSPSWIVRLLLYPVVCTFDFYALQLKEGLGSPTRYPYPYVGGFSNVSTTPFKGDIALFRFWQNYAFSPAEAGFIFSSGPCAAGEFGGRPGICQPCPAGFKSSAGSISCSQICPPGAYSSGSLCQGCQPGYFSKTIGGYCYACPAGSYQPLANQTSCMLCPAGSSSPVASSSSTCTICTAGSSSISGGLCVSCPPGSYQPLSNQT